MYYISELHGRRAYMAYPWDVGDAGYMLRCVCAAQPI